jgi:anti-anti-sigma regulatory factor
MLQTNSSDGRESAMLRITRRASEEACEVLSIEGRITSDNVASLVEECAKVSGGKTPLVLDLSRVGFADNPGVDALRDLRARGARLIGCSPLLHELLGTEP